MASKDLVSEEVLQELINKLEEIVNNYCHNLEYYTDNEVQDFFQADAQEITYYNGLINDAITSKNFLWSSKQIAEELAKSIIEANSYADNLVKNIASIKLKYVTSLPTSDISEHTIYILKASDGTSKDTLNLYNATDGWTSIGDFNISLDDYYDKTEIDTKMDLKANKTEVVANDKIVQTLGSTTNSSDTVLSTSGLQVEMDKKANDDEVIKKTSLVTTINSSSTDSEIVGAKTVYDNTITTGLHPENSNYNIDTIKDYVTTHVNPNSNGDIGTYPTEFGWGTFIQLPAKDYRSQILISPQGMYYRIMKGGIWQPWYKVNATEVTDTTTYPKETP